MIRLLIVGYCYGIRSERRLCEEAHLKLAYRWFSRLGVEGHGMQTQKVVPNAADPSDFSKAGIQPVDQVEQLSGVVACTQRVEYLGIDVPIRCHAERSWRDMHQFVTSTLLSGICFARIDPAACWKMESLIQGSGGRLSFRLNSPKRLTLLVR